MAAFFRKLMAEGSGLPVFLSSHPASEDRMQAIEAAIPAGRQFTPLPYTAGGARAR
jgi:predicted Zn-dependent protease